MHLCHVMPGSRGGVCQEDMLQPQRFEPLPCPEAMTFNVHPDRMFIRQQLSSEWALRILLPTTLAGPGPFSLSRKHKLPFGVVDQLLWRLQVCESGPHIANCQRYLLIRLPSLAMTQPLPSSKFGVGRNAEMGCREC